MPNPPPTPEPIRREDFARWQGGVDEKLRQLAESSEKTSSHVAQIYSKIEDLKTEVTRLVMFFGFMCVIGSALISVAVGLIIKHW